MDFVVNNDWDIDLNKLISESITVFADKFDKLAIDTSLKDLKEFFHTRLENWLVEENFRIDVVRAVISGNTKCSPVEAYEKCKFITDCIKSDDFLKIIGLYKRANNILKQAKGKNIDFENLQINEQSFCDEEKNLYADIKSFYFNEATLKSGEYKI